jgi:serine/threonine protein phosphatase PrpC
VTVLRSGSATDVGRVRRVNQDLPLEASNLFAVADGMGGHVGGEVAAQVAVDALLQVFSREPTKAGLEVAFSKANQAVWQESQDRAELRGMGTTLTAAALVGDDEGRDTLALANVGDSRAYLFSDNHLVQVTADHSLAEERMRHGEMSEEEAAVHPQRHILTRALGISTDVETDMWELQLRSGDRIILCSDGLSNELSTEQMAEVLAAEPDPEAAAHRLVDLANEHGGNDNITVVVVDVLVGEETSDASVITPIGARAGAPLVVAPEPTDGGAPASSLTKVAVGAVGAAGIAEAAEAAGAAGAAPPLSSEATDVTGVGNGTATGTGELLLQDTQAVPVARATVRTAAVAPPTPSQEAPPNESRRERRRRLGVPRRITFRVIFFIILVAAIPVGAFYAIRWYAYDNWYLAVQNDHIVVKQGRPGGVLWFQPRVVYTTKVTMSEVPAAAAAQIKAVVQEPSLHDAKSYVANLHAEFLRTQAAKNANANGATPGGATTTTLPGVTQTTSLGATTTVVPGAATTPTTVTPTTVP